MYNEDEGKWVAHTLKVIYFRSDGTIYKSERKDQELVTFPVSPKKLKLDRRQAGERSLRELKENIARGEDSGIDTVSLKTDFHVKLAFNFASFVVCLMGLKFAYASERSVESAKSVLLAVLLGMGYWVIHITASAMGRQGILPPLLAAWGANLMITVIAGLMIWRATIKR